MIEIIVLLCILVWIPVLLHQFIQRGYIVLLIWLFIAPVVTYGFQQAFAGFTPQDPEQLIEQKTENKRKGISYLHDKTTIRLQELLAPNRLVFGVFAVVFLLQTVSKRQRHVPFDRTEIWMAIFVFIAIASVLLKSSRVAFGLRVVSDAFVVPFLGYFVARRLVIQEDHLRQLIKVLAYMGFYLIIIGLIERAVTPGLTYRLKGLFPYRDAYYFVMMVVFFVVLTFWMSSSSGRRDGLISALMQKFLMSFAVVIIILTWTRGVWIGFLCGTWVFVFLGRRLMTTSRKLITYGLVLLLLPIGALIVQEVLQTEVVSRRITNPDYIIGRLVTYKRIWHEVTAHPLFGIGLNELRVVLQEDRISIGGMKNYVFSHQSYLAMLAELGIIGLGAYIAMVVSIGRMGFLVLRTGARSLDKWRGLSVIAIMVAYLVPPMSDSQLYQGWLSHVYIYVWVGGIAGLYEFRQHVLDRGIYAREYQKVAVSQHRQNFAGLNHLEKPSH
jgi:O-antigen ligase